MPKTDNAGSMVAASVSVSPYESFTVASVDCVVLVFVSNLAPTILLPTLLWSCPSLMFAHGSLSAAGGNLSDDIWARHQSLSIVEYH